MLEHAIDHKRPYSSTDLYYGSLMNIINLPIDITVANEVVEKRVVEEGCLVLLGENCRETQKNSFS